MPRALDPFRPHDPYDVATKFPETIVERARKRTVEPVGANQWVVVGDGKLGDSYPHYDVVLHEGRYLCSCTGHLGGEYRAARKCSHAVACMLWRQEHKTGAAPPAPPQDSSGGEGDGGEAQPSPPEGQVEGDRTTDLRRNAVADPAPSTAFLLDPHDRSLFGDPPLPTWVSSFRPAQVHALSEIVGAFDAHPVVWTEAPTGSGKTLLGECARRLLGTRAVYLCSTKQLQDQVEADFPYAVVLKGRANYPTLDYPDRFLLSGYDQLTCADCTRQPGEPTCAWCSDVYACPYEAARREAERAPLAVLNYSYYLAEANYVGRLRFPFAIADEADLLEEELMRFVEVTIPERTRKQLGVGEPAKKTVESAWVEYLRDELEPAIVTAIRKLPAEPTSVREIRELKRWRQLRGKVRAVLDGMQEGGWVYTGYDKGIVQFKPIRVGKYAREYLWRHANRWLCMSATIISADQMADDLGLTDE